MEEQNVPFLRIGKWTEKDTNVLKADGLIRLNPNKPEFGSMMLVETITTMVGGFIRRRNKTGFIVGTVADLEMIIKEKHLKVNDNFCEKVGPHRIVTSELLESEVPEGRAYKLKLNPRTNVPLTHDGEQIWWRRYVVPFDSPEKDQLIDHDRDVEGISTPRGEQHYENLPEDEVKEFKKAAKAQIPGK